MKTSINGVSQVRCTIFVVQVIRRAIMSYYSGSCLITKSLFMAAFLCVHAMFIYKSCFYFDTLMNYEL